MVFSSSFFPICKKKHILPWFKQAMHIMKKKEKKAKIVSIFSFRVSARTSQWSIEAKLVCASRILTLDLRFIARASFENKWKVQKNYVIHKHNEFFLIFFFFHSFFWFACIHRSSSNTKQISEAGRGVRPGDVIYRETRMAFTSKSVASETKLLAIHVHTHREMER